MRDHNLPSAGATMLPQTVLLSLCFNIHYKLVHVSPTPSSFLGCYWRSLSQDFLFFSSECLSYNFCQICLYLPESNYIFFYSIFLTCFGLFEPNCCSYCGHLSKLVTPPNLVFSATVIGILFIPSFILLINTQNTNYGDLLRDKPSELHTMPLLLPFTGGLSVILSLCSCGIIKVAQN